MQRQTILRLAAIVALAGLAACSGGGSPSSPAPQSNPAPGGGSAQSTTQTITFDGSAKTVDVPQVGNFSGTIKFAKQAPLTPASLTVQAMLSNPRTAAAQERYISSSGLLEVLFYYVLTPPQLVDISLQTVPSITITQTQPISVPTTTGQFYYGISTSPVNLGSATPNPYSTATPNPYSTYSPVGFTFLTEGPAKVSSNGQTFTFDEAPNPLTLRAGNSYIFVFYRTCTLSSGATSC